MTNYRIVPVEPIERMERAGAAVAHLSAVEAREIYAEMTFSAPDPADDAELVERVKEAINYAFYFYGIDGTTIPLFERALEGATQGALKAIQDEGE